MSALAPIERAAAEPLVVLDLEQQVIGGLLAHPKAWERVEAFLKAEHFGDARHAVIFQAIADMRAAELPATPTTLAAMMSANETLAKIGGASYLARVVTSVVAVAFTEDYARVVLDLAVRRSAIAVMEEASARLRRGDVSDQASKALGECSRTLDELAEIGTVPATTGIGAAAMDAIEAADNIATHGIVPQLVPTGFADLDELIDGFDPGSMIVIGARPSMGKAQPLDASVLLSDGTWRLMGDLRLGDALASVDGAQSRVAGIYPQGEREVFRVTFSDGRSAVACGEHLWRVGNRKWGEDKTLTTREIIALMKKPSYARRLYIPTVSGHFGHSAPLDIDPWLLGALIANGSLTSETPGFSTADADTLWQVQERVALAGGRVTRSEGGSGYDYRIAGERQRNSIAIALRSMGLSGKRSEEKFIPYQYLTANHEARAELLRGLLDTDGWVEKEGAVRYSTSSRRLAECVRGLVRSLGGLCAITEKRPVYTYKGERRHGLPHFVCRIRLTNPRQFIRLTRKARRAPENNEVRLNIVSIESVGVKPVQCIAVTHPSKLYVTDDYVVTHNTSLAQWMAYHAAKAGHGVAFFSIEMTQRRLTERWLSGLTGIPANNIKAGRVSQADLSRLTAAQEELRQLPVVLDLSTRPSMADIAASIRKMRRDGHKIELVIIDYLGLMKPIEQTRTLFEATTAISGEIKAAAKTLNLPIVVLSQLSRANESRDDKRPTLSDLRQSGAIEQDADIVMFVHREHYYLSRQEPRQQGEEDEAAFQFRKSAWDEDCARAKGKAEINVAKNRNGPIGTVDLAFVDHTTRFANLAREDR